MGGRRQANVLRRVGDRQAVGRFSTDCVPLRHCGASGGVGHMAERLRLAGLAASSIRADREQRTTRVPSLTFT